MTRECFLCFRILAAAMLLICICHLAIAETQPSVVAAGIRASRLTLTRGKLRIRRTDTWPAEQRREESIFLVEWEDDALRFIETLSDGTEIRRSIRSKGELLFRTKEYGGGLDDANKGYAHFLFDPRLLGAYPILSPSLMISDCLFASKGWSIALVTPSETIDGHECMVLRWSTTGFAQDYWVENAKGFPVRKIYDHNNNVQIESSYSPGQTLPDVVRMTYLSEGGVAERQTEFVIDSYTPEGVVSEHFSMAGLGLEFGESVTDQRLHQVVGYWNGTALSPSRHQAFDDANIRSSAPRRRLGMALGVVVVAAVVVVWCVLRQRGGAKRCLSQE